MHNFIPTTLGLFLGGYSASRLGYFEVNIENRYLISELNELLGNFSNITDEVFEG